MRSVRCLKLSIGIFVSLVGLMFSSLASAAPAVWSGLTYSFANTISVPAQDEITANVILARAATGGLYNAAYESAYVPDLSPEFTLWATEINNPAASAVTAANWAELNFADWRTAYGGAGVLAGNILGTNTVLYLVADDVYLDIQFTQWGQRFGGEFAYLRAVPIPEPATWTLAAACLLIFGGRRRRTNP